MTSARRTPKQSGTPPAVGYLRVSTEGQATDGISLDAQGAKVALWCEANGRHLVAVHQDAGLSGSRADNRPGLAQALDEVCRLKGALVVYSLSRLARSTKDALAMSERLERAGADLVSLSEKIDTTSAAGKMVFRLLAVLSEFERDQVAERTKAALQHLKAQGKLVGSVPVGYDLANDGETLVPSESEQATLDLIRRLRRRGASLRAIGMELQRRGVKTKTGNERWAPQVLKRLLDREEMVA
jgi:DNA invertase Pin-like site-specific DNA recombinase